MSRAEPQRKNVAGMVTRFPSPTNPTPVLETTTTLATRSFPSLDSETITPPVSAEVIGPKAEEPLIKPPEVLVFDRVDAPSLQNWTDTHIYDGQLKERIALYPSLRQKRHASVVKMMRKCFSNINSSPWLKKTLVENQQNYDPTNDVDATDILCSIYDIYSTDPSKKEIIENLMKEQFEDMATGFCSQGRCTRLLQVFFATKEN